MLNLSTEKVLPHKKAKHFALSTCITACGMESQIKTDWGWDEMRSAVPAQPPAAFTLHLPTPSLLTRDFVLLCSYHVWGSPSRPKQAHLPSAAIATVIALVLRLLLSAWVRPGTGRVLSLLGSCRRRTRSAPGTGPAWLRKGVFERALGDNYTLLQKYDSCRVKVEKYVWGVSRIFLWPDASLMGAS